MIPLRPFLDYFATLLVAWPLSRYMKENVFHVFIFLVFLSVPIHVLFGQETGLVRLLSRYLLVK